jgi:hypothetical protein
MLVSLHDPGYKFGMRIHWPIVAFAFFLGGAANTSPSVQARAALAAHDPYGRLPNTRIELRGTIRARRLEFSIYYLDFSNPLSLHGQQRIAIIKNDREFMGSYQCTLGKSKWDASMVIQKDRILVFHNSTPTNRQTPFVIRFTAHGPSHNRYFCGEGSGWENSI